MRLSGELQVRAVNHLLSVQVEPETCPGSQSLTGIIGTEGKAVLAPQVLRFSPFGIVSSSIHLVSGAWLYSSTGLQLKSFCVRMKVSFKIIFLWLKILLEKFITLQAESKSFPGLQWKHRRGKS